MAKAARGASLSQATPTPKISRCPSGDLTGERYGASASASASGSRSSALKLEPTAGSDAAADAPILMIEGPKVQNSVLDLVLAYMADMSVKDLGLVQLRYIELMNLKLGGAAEDDAAEAA